MRYAKAIVAMMIAGLGVMLTSLDNGGISGSEWIQVALAALSALGLTYVVPNTPTPERKYMRP